MKKRLCVILIIGVFIFINACVSAKIANMSSEIYLPSSPNLKTINTTAYVRCSDPLNSANEDLANALKKESVFSSVVAISSGENLSENNLEILVTPDIIENDFFSEELVKAIFRGLLLSLADGAFADKYEYTVNLKVAMRRGEKNVGTYEATAKYYAQQPENKKTAQISEVRKLAWEHVLNLIVAKIKADGKKAEGT